MKNNPNKITDNLGYHYLNEFIKFDSDLSSDWFTKKLYKNLFWYENQEHYKIFNANKKYSKFNQAKQPIYKGLTDEFTDEFTGLINKLNFPCYIIYQNFSLLFTEKSVFIEFISNYRFGLTEFCLVDVDKKSISINHELLYYYN
jgi:hypothetical protein